MIGLCRLLEALPAYVHTSAVQPELVPEIIDLGPTTFAYQGARHVEMARPLVADYAPAGQRGVEH